MEDDVTPDDELNVTCVRELLDAVVLAVCCVVVLVVWLATRGVELLKTEAYPPPAAMDSTNASSAKTARVVVFVSFTLLLERPLEQCSFVPQSR